jgi:aminocarboxymuconate-semialdehyde decarboxylase
MAGTDRVMVGSDYPFDMGDEDSVGRVNKTNLSDADRQNLPCGNVGRLFRIA